MTERFGRRVATKPHQRRQPRWVETVACGSPTRRTISPAESSPLSPSSRRMRSLVGSPSPRKNFPSNSTRLGESANANGEPEMTSPAVCPSLATQEGVSSMAFSDYPHAICAICAKWGPVDQKSRCPVCLSAAIDRAALLDDLDMAIRGLIGLGVNEIQLRCALIMAIDGKEGTLYQDFVERRRDGD